MHDQVLKVFAAAMEQPAATRKAWIEATCAHDPELASAVLALHDADSKAESMLPTGGVWQFAEALTPGQRFDRYQIIELIGAGGMGAVYRAKRIAGDFDQTVAIKILANQSSTPEGQARFLNERQILAGLEHPNIARLIDGGTDQKLAFIAMEYVEGQPLVHDPSRPETETLKLFKQVCDAVSYAHNNLILHRDIKPENVLVTADGVPKLLDFGVAKMTQEIQAGVEQDLTSVNPAPLTPNFAAPERLVGEPATIGSDVYSLGVFLYSLIHGRLPYNIRGQAYQEAFNTAIQRSQSSKTSDLDVIISTAMHPDPERRFTSVAALADDIDRYLTNRAIQSRGDDWRYLLSKVVSRYKFALASAGLGIMALITALIVSIYQTNIAEQQTIRAESMSRFLSSVFVAIDPNSGTNLGPEASLRQLLEVSESLIAQEFAADPITRAQVYALFGRVYGTLQLYPESERMLEAATAIQQDSSLSYTQLGSTILYSQIAHLQQTGDIAGASELCDVLLEHDSVFADEVMNRIFYLGTCANVRALSGQTDAARVLADRSLGILRQSGAAVPQHQRITLLSMLTNVYHAFGDGQQADLLIDEAVAIAQDMGESAYSSLAWLYLIQSLGPNQVGDHATSLTFTTKAVATARLSKLARDGLMYAYIHLYHADRLIDVGRVEEAAQVYAPAREVLLQNTPEFASYHSLVYFTDYKLAFAERNFELAAASLIESKRIRQGSGEAYGQWFAATDHALGKTYIELEKYQEAVPLLQRAYDFYLQLYGAGHERVNLYQRTLENAQQQMAAAQ